MKHPMLLLSLLIIFGCTSKPINPESFQLRDPANKYEKDYLAEILAPISQEEYDNAEKVKKGDVAQKGRQMSRLFDFARTEPQSFFNYLRNTSNEVKTEDGNVVAELKNGILVLKGTSGGAPNTLGTKIISKLPIIKNLEGLKAKLGFQRVPDIIVASKYDDVIEGLERNQDFTVYTNRVNMNNTVGPFMLAYEESETFDESTREARYKDSGIEIHPGKLSPHKGKALKDHSINFRDEKALMWKLVNSPEDKTRVREIAWSAAMDGLARGGFKSTKDRGKIDIVQYITRAVPIAVVQQYFGFDPVPSNPNFSRELLAFWSRWTQNSFFHNPTRDPEINKMAIYATRGLKRYKNETNNPGVPGKKSRPEDPTTGETVLKKYDKGMNYFVQQLIARRRALLEAKGVIPSRNIGQAMAKYHKEFKPKERTTVDLMLIAAPIHSENQINEERLIANTMGLLVGAVETANSAAVQSLRIIMQNEQLKNLALSAVRNKDYDKFNRIVWEALRFDPINPWVARLTLEKTSLGGVDIEPGSLVLLSTESAMMDPEQFDNPLDFNFDRYEDANSGKADYSSHPLFLHMGAKRHTCLGFDVAYEFVPAALFKILEQLPNVKEADMEKGFSMAVANPEYFNPFPESYVLTYEK